jgi:universal stress protein E
MPPTEQPEVACPLHPPAPAPMFSRILVVVDPTASAHPGVDKAARTALRCGAEIELYICDVEQDATAEPRGERHARYLALLEHLAAPLRAQGTTVTTHSEWRAPLEQGIALHVIRTRPDLVVKDSARQPPASRAPVTLTDWVLMRQIPAPLLLVRTAAWPRNPRIAVSADPCRPAERPVSLDEALLDAGCALAGMLDAGLQVVHVMQGPAHLPGEATSLEERRRQQQAARETVEGLVANRNRLGRRIPVQYAEGRPAEVIPQLAGQKKIDVLVMGSAARSHSSTMAAGGTAARILTELPCDLLVIKPPGFVSPLLVTDD